MCRMNRVSLAVALKKRKKKPQIQSAYCKENFSFTTTMPIRVISYQLNYGIIKSHF